jgi:hypothetical protein
VERGAVGTFVDDYDDYDGFWRPEKRAFKIPLEARRDYLLCLAA